MTAEAEQIFPDQKGKYPRLTIQERFELYPADFIEDTEIDWGQPIGDEEW